MSLSVLILPPITLIPVCWVMDAVASAILVRGSLSEADRSVLVRHGQWSGIRLPIGLTLTGWLPVDDSRLAALCLIITLRFFNWPGSKPHFSAVILDCSVLEYW